MQCVKLVHLHTGLSSMSRCATEAYAVTVYVTSQALRVKILSVNIQKCRPIPKYTQCIHKNSMGMQYATTKLLYNINFTHTHHGLDCAVGATDRFLSSMSPFMCVESNSGVADRGAAAAWPGTRVVEWLCAELPDCSSTFES